MCKLINRTVQNINSTCKITCVDEDPPAYQPWAISKIVQCAEASKNEFIKSF